MCDCPDCPDTSNFPEQDRVIDASTRITALVDAAWVLIQTIEAHETESLDCDRCGDKYCDCLQRATDKLKSVLAGKLWCHAGKDGECNWSACPQSRDNEPLQTGRFCPFPKDGEDALI